MYENNWQLSRWSSTLHFHFKFRYLLRNIQCQELRGFLELWIMGKGWSCGPLHSRTTLPSGQSLFALLAHITRQTRLLKIVLENFQPCNETHTPVFWLQISPGHPFQSASESYRFLCGRCTQIWILILQAYDHPLAHVALNFWLLAKCQKQTIVRSAWRCLCKDCVFKRWWIIWS